MKWEDLGALFTPSEKTKLAGVDTGATDDQTGAEIKTAYEGEANAYTDTKNTKLSGIDTGATNDQTGAEVKALYEAEADTNAYDDAAVTKLGGIEAAATADQTGGEIKTAYEGEVDAYTDAKNTKLGGIDTGADVTGDNPPQSHGASVHTDRKRTMFLSAPMYYTSGGDMTENGLRMVPDATIEAVYYFKVPEDFSSVTQLRAIYHTFYNGAAQNAYVFLKAYYGGLGEHYSIHQETSLYYTIDMTGKTAGVLYESHHASVGLASLAKDDFIRVYFKRKGDSASDTWVYDIMLIGIELEYVADM